jgi:hypothetical protein
MDLSPKANKKLFGKILQNGQDSDKSAIQED